MTMAISRRAVVLTATSLLALAVFGTSAYILHIGRTAQPPGAPPSRDGWRPATVDLGAPVSGVEESTSDLTELKPHLTVHQPNADRMRRYEFTPPIGDIMRIAYHRASGALLMAVVEPDGLRSIWKLSADQTYRRVLPENNLPGDIFLSVDSRDRLYAQFDNPGTLYRSADAGETWKPVARNIGGTFWTIADDGRGTLWGTQHAENTAILYRSTDDGLSWQAWRDFQQLYPEYAMTYATGDARFRLRHLHAVAYVDGRLFVGTGDVARFTVMTTDGGASWRQVWDEGFTAAVPTAESDGLVLGPDRLRAHGLARYDFASNRTFEIWNPVPYNYAGYTYSVVQHNHVYLAAFHTEANEVQELTSKSGIIASPDTVRWFPYFTVPALSNHARTDMFLADTPDAVFLSYDGALFDFQPYDRWTYNMLKPFGQN